MLLKQISVCPYCNKRIVTKSCGDRPNINSHIEEEHIGVRGNHIPIWRKH